MDIGGTIGVYLEWIVSVARNQPAMLAGVIFVIAFLESIAFVSLLVPSTAILAGLGLMIGAGDLPFWTPFFAAVLGAFTGDWISYEVGRRYKSDVKEMWPLNKDPALFEKGESFFRRYGAPGYFAGRFVGPLRAVFPLICGITAMRPLLFYATNGASAIAWAGAYLGGTATVARLFG
jgi:membrane protein DedA with SNARE-associated domain